MNQTHNFIIAIGWLAFGSLFAYQLGWLVLLPLAGSLGIAYWISH